MLDSLTVALFFHLLGALMLVSGMVVAGAAFESARRRRSAAEIAALLSLTRVGVILVGVGALLLLGFGLWLVHLAGFSYSAGWISAALALYVVAMALGGIGGQRPKQARLLATRLAAEGASVNDELRGLLDDRASRAENYLSGLAVLVIFGLMVFKP
jgi:uncharacterized membrane protein